MDNHRVDFEKSLGALNEMLHADDNLDLYEMSQYITKNQAIANAASKHVIEYSPEDLKRVITLAYKQTKLQVEMAEKYGIKED